jgi:uncharacterized membrane protein YgcG
MRRRQAGVLAVVALATLSFLLLHFFTAAPRLVAHRPVLLRGLIVVGAAPPSPRDDPPHAAVQEPLASSSVPLASSIARARAHAAVSVRSDPAAAAAAAPAAAEARHAICMESASAALRRARAPVAVPAEWRRRREASFQRYVALHHAFLSPARDGATVHVPGRGALPRRFLLVKPCCQLCNRVRVLVSALALGILTDRAVLMEFDGNGHDGEYYGRFADLFDAPLRVQATLPADGKQRAYHGTGDGAAGGGADGDGGGGGTQGGGAEGGGGGSSGAHLPSGGRSLPWLSMMSDLPRLTPHGTPPHTPWDPTITLDE